MAKKENSNVIRLILATAFILAFFFVINPLTRDALAIFLVLLAVSLFVYSSRQYQTDLIGVGTKNLGKSFGYSILFVGLYYLTTRFVPAFSIGLPLLPNAISDSLKFIILVLVAPLVEEIFFRGSLLGYVRNFKPSKKAIWIAIFIQAFLFALFHLGAYIAGFYALPSIASGFGAISANFSAFITAFIFGILAGIFVTRDGIKNLFATMFFHAGINLLVYASLSVVFA